MNITIHIKSLQRKKAKQNKNIYEWIYQWVPQDRSNANVRTDEVHTAFLFYKKKFLTVLIFNMLVLYLHTIIHRIKQVWQVIWLY